MLFCFFDKSGYRMSMQVIGLDGSMISLEALGDVFCRHVAYFYRCIMLHCELYWTLIEKPEPQVGWKRNGSAGKAHRSTSALIDPSVPTSSGISRRNADVFPGVGISVSCWRSQSALGGPWGSWPDIESRGPVETPSCSACAGNILYIIYYIYMSTARTTCSVCLSRKGMDLSITQPNK